MSEGGVYDFIEGEFNPHLVGKKDLLRRYT